MFKLVVKKEFSSAHILHGHPGDCKRMHGHNWIVEAKIEGDNINSIGMVIDFKDIKKSLANIISKLDHRFLNEIEPFTEDNPTAENISKYIYKELSKNINTDNIKVSEIKLWETNNSAVIYTEWTTGGRMSTSKSKLEISNLPDTQGQADTRNMPINKVGIKDIVHPMIIKQRSGKEQSTIANFNMYVNLPHDFKGTHMSRFVHILNKHEEQITVDSFKKMIDEMLILLEAESGHIEMKFPYFINKTAPVSKVKSLLDYSVSLIGEIEDGTSKLKVNESITGESGL